MEELPHSLRREIAFNINKKIFRQLSIFTDFPVSQQAAICGMMTPLQVYDLPHKLNRLIPEASLCDVWYSSDYTA